MALGSPPQFNNYFLNPYLSGTYGYETYKPYDNLFLNSSLLTQDIMSRKEQAGPINNSVGSSILGGGLFNQLFGSGQPQASAGPVFAPFGSPPPANLMGGYGGGQAPSAGGGIGASLDKLISLLEGLTGDTAVTEPPVVDVPDVPEAPVVDVPEPSVVDAGTDNSELTSVITSLLQVLTGGGQPQQQQGYGYGMPQQSPMSAIMGMNPFSGGGGVPSFNTGSFGNPFSFMANPMSIFGGLGGSGSSLAGSNPLPSFSPNFGAFSNSPNQNPGFPALATLDPVIRSSIFSEVASPIFGNILANGGIPPFRSQFFN